MRHERAAGRSVHQRDPMPFREHAYGPAGTRVADAATDDQQWPMGRPEDLDRFGKRGRVRSRPGDAVESRREHRRRKRVRLGLHVLWQRDDDGAGIGRVGEDAGDLRKRGDELLGSRDPIEIPTDRPERVIDRGRRVTERLDLLEHRVRRPALEGVAGEQEDRDPVRVRDAGGRDHVERTRADRRRRDHHLSPVHRLPEADRREGHPLLGIAAPGRQPVAFLVEGRAETEHVAVPEDAEHAREQGHLGAVEELGSLGDHPADERLCGRELHRRHAEPPGGDSSGACASQSISHA